MKARIKKTGEIVNLASYAKITLESCDSYGDPIELSPEEVELVQETSDSRDWEERRYEIAKVFLPHAAISVNANREEWMIGMSYPEASAVVAVRYADALVEHLKKNKQ